MIYCTEGVSIFLNWTSILGFTLQRVSLYYSIWQVYYALLYRGCLYIIQLDKYILIYCTEGVSIFLNWTSILGSTVQRLSLYYSIWLVFICKRTPWWFKIVESRFPPKINIYLLWLKAKTKTKNYSLQR